MEINNSMELDIDSDILRSLTFLDLLKTKYKETITRDIITNTSDLLYQNFTYFNRIFQCIKTGEIKAVINDVIFAENDHSKSILKFIQKYCYFPDINLVNRQRIINESEDLARAYCSPYIGFDGRKHAAPMKRVFNSSTFTDDPPTDIRGLARAVTSYRCFLTANGKHLIFDETKKIKNHDKTNGIIKINLDLGYYKTTKNGDKLIPKPIHLHTFGALLKDGIDHISIISSYKDLIRADKILTDEEIDLITSSYDDPISST